MSFRFPNGKNPQLIIETFAIDFEIIGQLEYIKSCIHGSPYQRDAYRGINVLISEPDYDFDSLNQLVVYLADNKVAIAALKVGNLEELVSNLVSSEDIITIGKQPPKTWSFEGITHMEPQSIENLCRSDALKDLWPIQNRRREIAKLNTMFLL